MALRSKITRPPNVTFALLTAVFPHYAVGGLDHRERDKKELDRVRDVTLSATGGRTLVWWLSRIRWAWTSTLTNHFSLRCLAPSDGGFQSVLKGKCIFRDPRDTEHRSCAIAREIHEFQVYISRCRYA